MFLAVIALATAVALAVRSFPAPGLVIAAASLVLDDVAQAGRCAPSASPADADSPLGAVGLGAYSPGSGFVRAQMATWERSRPDGGQGYSAAAVPTTERGSAAASNVPVGEATMQWACPNAEPNAGPISTEVATAGELVAPRGGGTVLHDDGGRRVAGPRVEAGWCDLAARPVAQSRPRPASRPGAQQAGGELGDDLRLGVAAHRAEDGAEPRRRRVAIAGTSVWGGRRPGASSAGCPALEGEAEPTIVQVDARGRLDEPRPEPGRVRLDQADRPATIIGRAQVRRVAAPARCGQCRCPLCVEGVDTIERPCEQRCAVGALVQHGRAVVRGELARPR